MKTSTLGTLVETAKLSPPTAISALNIGSGIDVQAWILILTLVYTTLLVAHKLFVMFKDARKFVKNLPDTDLSPLKE